MKVVGKCIERSMCKKDCMVIVATSDGTEITMYGEISDGHVEENSTAPSYWNSKLFEALSEEEQSEVVYTTNNALRELL